MIEIESVDTSPEKDEAIKQEESEAKEKARAQKEARKRRVQQSLEWAREKHQKRQQ